jgi:hypothetical protein
MQRLTLPICATDKRRYITQHWTLILRVYLYMTCTLMCPLCGQSTCTHSCVLGVRKWEFLKRINTSRPSISPRVKPRDALCGFSRFLTLYSSTTLCAILLSKSDNNNRHLAWGTAGVGASCPACLKMFIRAEDVSTNVFRIPEVHTIRAVHFFRRTQCFKGNLNCKACWTLQIYLMVI